MTSVAEKICQWICDHRQQFIDKLKQVVEIESPSTIPESNIPLFRFFAKELEQLGYRSSHLPGQKTGGLLLASPDKRPKNRKFQLLLGHCDTVWPPGTLQSMPFKHENGKIYGPGIYDMKAGLIEIVLALKALKNFKIAPLVTPVILITSDEEIGSIESRGMLTRLAKIAHRCYVLEPSLDIDAKLKTSRKGVGMFDISVLGVSAHSGLEPEKGASAIVEMTRIVQELYKLSNPEKGTTVNVGTIEGGERANVIAAKSKIAVDVRVLTQEEAERVETSIYNITPSKSTIKIQIEGGIDRPPMEKNEPNKKLWQVAKRLGHNLGIELQDGCSGGASDGNITSQFCATLDGLGAVGDGAHAVHEHINVTETLMRASLLALLIAEPPLNFNQKG